jgi:predicted phosphodiesterase
MVFKKQFFINQIVWPVLLGFALLLLPAAAWSQTAASVEPFLVKPYLQLGSAAPALDSLSLLWHAPDEDRAWSVAVKPAGQENGEQMLPATWVRVAVAGVEPHRIYTAVLRPLAPGARFAYRVILDGKTVFQGEAGARKGPGEPTRVAVMGDLATGKEPPKAIAWQLYRQKPDLVVVPGDIVYEDGRISEYRRNFFPVYNADQNSAEAGAPLLRSTLFVGALGNHDVGERGPKFPYTKDPDGLAYYLYWDQPLNGPPLRPEGPHAPPLVPGGDWTWQAFLEAAGNRFPTMGNFSFDFGNAHWTVLDSNTYVRWEAKELQDWLARDLDKAKGATWRFVVFHHPVSNLAEGNYYIEQWMARVWPLLERYRVDIAFTGHIHTYMRTQPIRFEPDPDALANLDPRTQQGEVKGKLTWDARFDGKKHTRAQGVIHIVTGGGGANLHLKGKAALFRLKPYVAKAASEENSFSLLDIKGRSLTFRQLNAQGEELDRFTLAK